MNTPKIWNWFRSLWRKDEASSTEEAASVEAFTEAGLTGTALPPGGYRYTPKHWRPPQEQIIARSTAVKQDNPPIRREDDASNDLLAGMLIGAAISSEPVSTPETTSDTPKFEGFGGGESGGGGASGSWDPPSSDSSSLSGGDSGFDSGSSGSNDSGGS